MRVSVKVVLSLFILYQLLGVRIESVKLQPFRKKLIVSTILDSAYLSLREGHEYYEGNEKFEGFLKGLTDLLAQKIGFTYELRLVKDSAFGHLQNDSTWNGMIGEVLRGEADMAVSSMTINSIRSKYIDFSTAFIQLRLGVLMKRPEGPLQPLALNLTKKPHRKRNSTQFLFLKPLTWPLWASIIVAAIVKTGLLYFLEWAHHNKIRVRGWMTNDQVNSGNLEEAIGDFQFSFSQPKSLAGQLLRITFLVFVTTIVSGYISHFYCGQCINLKTQTHKSRKSPFDVKMIEELARQNNEIKFSVIAHGSTAHYLQKSPNPTLRRIYRRITAENNFVRSVAHGVNLVVSSNGSYAFITEELTAKYISSHVCNTFVATYPFGPHIGFGVVVPQNSSLLRQINLAIAEMKDDLTLANLEDEWLVDSGKCDTGVQVKRRTKRKNPNQIPKSRPQLNMQNSAGMFYIWIFLLLTSAATALLEVRVITNRISKGNNIDAGSPEVTPRAGEIPEALEMAEVQL